MEFITGITLQIFALIIVLTIKRRRWFSSTGAIFVVMIFVLHGVIEIISRVFFKDILTARENFFIGKNDVDSFVLYVGVALFIFSIVYGITQYGLPLPKKIKTELSPEKKSLNFKSVFLVCLLLLPAIFLVGLSEEESGYWVNGILVTFLMPITIISLCWFLIKNNFEHAIFWVAILALSITALGSRSTVMLSVAATLSILFRYGMSFNLRKLIPISFVVMSLVFTIFMTRSVIGRKSISTLDGLDRAKSGIESVQAVLQSNDGTFFSTNDIVKEFVGRLDANFFGSLIYSILRIYPPPGFSSMWIDVELAIPRFLNKSNTKVDEEDLFEKHYYLREIDYAPHVFGSLYAYSGLSSLWIGAAFLALLYGFVDRWLSFKYSLNSIIIEYFLLVATFHMESGIKLYFAAFRTSLFLVVVLTIIYFILRLFKKQSILEIEMCDKTDK